MAIRLGRTLLTPQVKGAVAKPEGSLLPQQREPVEVSLLVDPAETQASNRTLDKSIHFGETYEYWAQRVTRIAAADETLELAGPLSEPVRVEAIGVFPPNVPTGLAAVATAPDQAGGPSIDLSWQPVTNPDLAGYAVYRRQSVDAGRKLAANLSGPARCRARFPRCECSAGANIPIRGHRHRPGRP